MTDVDNVPKLSSCKTYIKYFGTVSESFNDIVVPADVLLNLTGKSHRAKRQAIKNFEGENPHWQRESITHKNIDTVFSLERAWQRVHPEYEKASKISALFREFSENELFGIMLHDGKTPIGYSIMAGMGDGYALMLVMRVISKKSGSYAMLIRESARQAAEHLPEFIGMNMGCHSSPDDITIINSYAK